MLCSSAPPLGIVQHVSAIWYRAAKFCRKSRPDKLLSTFASQRGVPLIASDGVRCNPQRSTNSQLSGDLPHVPPNQLT